MGNSLDALKLLAGSGMASNAQAKGGLVQGRVNREDALTDMKRNIGLAADPRRRMMTGATPFDVADEEQSLADDQSFGTAEQHRIADIGAMNDKMGAYNRPDVAVQRKHDESVKLALAGEPARVAGAANIESAKQANGFKNDALGQLLGAAQNGSGQHISVDGVGSIWADPSVLQGQKAEEAARQQSRGINAQSLRDRLKLLETGKAHANNPGFGGMFGIGAKAADDAEIASIQKQLASGGQDSTEPRPAQADTGGGMVRVIGPAGERGSVPHGTPLLAGWRLQ